MNALRSRFKPVLFLLMVLSTACSGSVEQGRAQALGVRTPIKLPTTLKIAPAATATPQPLIPTRIAITPLVPRAVPTPTPLPPPVITQAIPWDAGQNLISWEPVPGASGYLVSRRLAYAGESFRLLATVPPTSNAYTDTAADCSLAGLEYRVQYVLNGVTSPGAAEVVWNGLPCAAADARIVKVEVVQAIQCFSSEVGGSRSACGDDNSVPLYTGKPTMVRAYVSAGSNDTIPVGGRICRGSVSTCDTGFIRSFNTAYPRQWGSGEARLLPVGDLNWTVNFVLPMEWVNEGPLQFSVWVNYNQEDAGDPNPDNNGSLNHSFDLLPARRLEVAFFPVKDNLTADGGQRFAIANWLSRVMPISEVVIRDDLAATIEGRFDFASGIRSTNGTLLTCGVGWEKLLSKLWWLDVSTRNDANVNYYGLVHQDEDQPREADGCGLWGWQSAGIVTPGSRHGGLTAAEELGHNFGRRHAPGCGASFPDPNFPTTDGRLGEAGLHGFDIHRLTHYGPDAYDYMGYCGNEGNTWTSRYTYQAVYDAIGGASDTARVPREGADLVLASGVLQTESVFLVASGRITGTGFALEDGFFQMPLPAKTTDGSPNGPYTVELLDEKGKVLFSRDFGVLPTSMNGDPAGPGPFILVLPAMPGTSQAVFRAGSGELARVAASPGAPKVKLLSPNGGERWGASGPQTIAWQASDPDGDQLRFILQYSRDGGQTWQALAVNLEDANSFQVDGARLPGGNLLVRVLASDGFHTAADTSDAPFSVDRKGPIAGIGWPADGVTIRSGQPVVLMGYGSDVEDGAIANGKDFAWRSSLSGDLGAGKTLVLQGLPPGTHRITLQVKDADGNVGTSAVTLTVQPSE